MKITNQLPQYSATQKPKIDSGFDDALAKKTVKQDILFVGRHVLSVLLIATSLLLTSCVSQANFNAVVSENEQLEMQIANLMERMSVLQLAVDAIPIEPEMVMARATGGVTLTVLNIIPDVVLDGITPRFAVVHGFQDFPFMIELTDGLAEEINVGDTKFFTPDAKFTEKIPMDDIGKPATMPHAFSAAREPIEGETGLNSNHLVWKKVND